MVAKKNNNKRTFIIIISVLLLVILVYSIYAGNKNDKRINYTEFKQMVKTEQVDEVYINDYTIYVKKVNSKIKDKNFPDEYDYYCSYMNNEVVISFIEEYNESKWLNIGDYYDEVTGTITRADQITAGQTPVGQLVTEARWQRCA